MVEEELLPFSCQPAADQPLCTQLHLPSPSFGGGGRSGGKGQMFAKLRKAFHHLQLKWPGSSLLPSSLPHVPAVTKAPVLPQALSIPWLHSTSLAWTTGGASLLSLCFHACPKLSQTVPTTLAPEQPLHKCKPYHVIFLLNSFCGS